MPKLVNRIVAFLLVPCLLVDPALASIGPVGAGLVPVRHFGQAQGLPLQLPFVSQALAPATVLASPTTLHAPTRTLEEAAALEGHAAPGVGSMDNANLETMLAYYVRTVLSGTSAWVDLRTSKPMRYKLTAQFPRLLDKSIWDALVALSDKTEAEARRNLLKRRIELGGQLGSDRDPALVPVAMLSILASQPVLAIPSKNEPITMEISAFLNLLSTKYGTRALLRGSRVLQPKLIALFQPDAVEMDRIRQTEGLHVLFIRRLLKLAAPQDLKPFDEVVAAILSQQIQGPVVYKPIGSAVGRGIFMLEPLPNGRFRLTMIRNPHPHRGQNRAEASEEFLSMLRQSGVDVQPNATNSILTTVLDLKQIPVGKILQNIRTSFSHTHTEIYDAGMMEEQVSPIKVRGGHAFETRFMLSGHSVSHGTVRTGKDSYSRVGASAEFANVEGFQQVQVLESPDLLNPLFDEAYVPAERRDEFLSYVNGQLNDYFNDVRQGMARLGLTEDFPMTAEMDIMWLPADDTSHGFPRLCLNELKLTCESMESLSNRMTVRPFGESLPSSATAEPEQSAGKEEVTPDVGDAPAVNSPAVPPATAVQDPILKRLVMAARELQRNESLPPIMTSADALGFWYQFADVYGELAHEALALYGGNERAVVGDIVRVLQHRTTASPPIFENPGTLERLRVQMADTPRDRWLVLIAGAGPIRQGKTFLFQALRDGVLEIADRADMRFIEHDQQLESQMARPIEDDPRVQALTADQRKTPKILQSLVQDLLQDYGSKIHRNGFIGDDDLLKQCILATVNGPKDAAERQWLRSVDDRITVLNGVVTLHLLDSWQLSGETFPYDHIAILTVSKSGEGEARQLKLQVIDISEDMKEHRTEKTAPGAAPASGFFWWSHAWMAWVMGEIRLLPDEMYEKILNRIAKIGRVGAWFEVTGAVITIVTVGVALPAHPALIVLGLVVMMGFGHWLPMAYLAYTRRGPPVSWKTFAAPLVAFAFYAGLALSGIYPHGFLDFKWLVLLMPAILHIAYDYAQISGHTAKELGIQGPQPDPNLQKYGRPKNIKSRVKSALHRPALKGSHGSYQLISKVEEGGGATVYRAKRVARKGKEEKLVAVKMGKLVEQLDKESWLGNERYILSKLKMPPLSSDERKPFAQLIDTGMTEDGHAFLVMDYVEGIDLTTFLEQHPEPMQPGEAIALALQILYALQIVHGAGVAHNDLKPANIMLDENNPTGKVTLIDFGQGTFMRNSNELPGLTSRYTAHYSAPEVRAGVSAGPRSDLYSVGIILCDLLRVGLRRNGSPADLTPPVTTPKELWDVILKATGSLAHRGSGAARSSHHGAADEEIVRYEDAAQIIAALQALLPPETGQPHSNPPAAQAGTSPSKSPTSTSKAPGATPASIAFLLALFEGHIENAVARGKRGLWWEMGIGASLGTLSVLWSVLGLPYAIFPALAIMLATLLYSDVHIGIEEQISVERGLSPPRWGDRLVRLVVLMLYVISGFVLVLVHWLHGNIPPKVQVDGWIMLAFAPLIHYAYDHWQFHRFEAARVAEAKRREYVNGQGKDNWAVLPVPNTDRLRDVGNKELEARRRQWLEPLMRRDASIYALGILEQNNPDLKYVYVYNGLSGTDQAIEPVPVPFDKAFKKKVFEGTILYDDADGRGLWINLGAAPAAGNSDITFLGAGVNFFAFLAALLSGKSTFNHGDYLTPEANTDWHKIRNEYRTAFRKIFSLILGGTWRRGLAPVINFVIHMAPLTNGWKTFRRALAALCSNCRPTFQAKLAAAA